MTTRLFRSVLFFTLFLASPHPARGTVVVPADLGDLSREARAIVRGRVMALDVEGYLKGALGQTLQFRVPGGELGRFRSITVGAPEFGIDERIIVFLGASGPSIPYVLGLNQGVFRMARTADGWVVTPPPVLPSAAGSVRVVRGDASRRTLALAVFEQRVRALAAGQR